MDFKINEINRDSYDSFIRYLISLKDIKNQIFVSKLIKTRYILLGIKSGVIRDICKRINKIDIISFFKFSNNKYYEEVIIEGILLEKTEDFDIISNYVLNKVDNWGICDSLKAGFITKNLSFYFEKIEYLCSSNEEYLERFGFSLLRMYYLKTSEYLERIFELIEKKSSSYYYVNMMKSWLLADIIVKFEKEALLFLNRSTLDKWTFNKAISKARDSFRVRDELKIYLKSFKKK